MAPTPTPPLLHLAQMHPHLQQHQNPLQSHRDPHSDWRIGTDQNLWSQSSSHLGYLPPAADPSHPTQHRLPCSPPAFTALPPQSHHHPVLTPTNDKIVCLWGACRDTFASQADLVAHVNVIHLRVDPPPVTPTSSIRERDTLACHWADCGIQLPALDRCLTESENENLSTLASHLLQDHLGLRPSIDLEVLLASLAPPTELTSADATSEVVAENSFDGLSSSSQGTLIPQYTGASHASSTSRTSDRRSTKSSKPIMTLDRSFPSQKMSSGASSSTSSPAAADHRSSCLCRWTQCGKAFENVDVLSAHILTDHVGSGKREYHCHWENCDRNGAKAFASKQKILRHLQASSIHLQPLRECGQHFSEAATLQQHMRRHTSEKPFACDFPGCEKTFAVAGALTIHKRTHTGAKPFKCTYCDKAFTESSNLAKHIRTHTGDKPYICCEAGCNKRFCRPDQLNRHRIVHMKKEGIQKDDTPEDSGVDVSMSVE
ncbi:zinc-finger protein [Tulasnella sp. 331]|nr:zinc-finger protein [Tulasnella sp. 331]